MAISQVVTNSIASGQTITSPTLVNPAFSGTPTGTLASANMPAGSVLQVVNFTYNTSTSAATNTWIDTGLTATITPKFATSKILVTVNVNGVYKDTNNTWVWLRCMLNGSLDVNLGTFLAYNALSSPNSVGTVGTSYLSNPATTSPCTYKIQMASGNNAANAYFNVSSADCSSFTLMEIAQ